MSLTQIGTSGLLASQKSLTVASNNIANAETEGYSRQTVQYTPTYTLYPGIGALGTGVSASSVNRIASDFLTAQIWESQSWFSETQIRSQYLNDLDQWLGNQSTSLAGGFESFFSALNGSSVDPYSSSSRQVVITESEGMAGRFNTLYAQLDGQAGMIGQQLQASADQANSLLTNIASFNDQLRALSTGSQPANELMDQRDQAVRELSEILSVNALEQPDGSYSLYMKTGQPLVLGNRNNTLIVTGQVDQADGFQLELVAGQAQIPLSGDVGGALGGLLAYQSGALVQARNELGRLAVVVADRVNSQLLAGEDVNGNSGTELFNDLTNPVGAVMPLNTVSTAVSALRINDANQLMASDYDLRVDNAGNYSITRRSDQSMVASGVLSGAGTDTLSFDGVEMDIDATATDQSYRLAPVRYAARELNVVLSDPAVLAFAAVGSGPGDNTNLLSLVALQSQNVMNNGQSTLATGYSGFVGDMAVLTSRIKTESEGSATLLTQAEAARGSYSGVNLDEEAASLLRFQQLYSANARVISVARSTFDALLAMF